MRGFIEFVAIVLISVGMAVAYGIVHDQITARVCVEYFTIEHEPLSCLSEQCHVPSSAPLRDRP
jgi:hypothetical protein